MAGQNELPEVNHGAFKKLFNTSTIDGRARVVLAWWTIYAACFAYFKYKPSKK